MRTFHIAVTLAFVGDKYVIYLRVHYLYFPGLFSIITTKQLPKFLRKNVHRPTRWFSEQRHFLGKPGDLSLSPEIYINLRKKSLMTKALCLREHHYELIPSVYATGAH